MSSKNDTAIEVRNTSQVARTDDYDAQIELAKEVMRRLVAAYGPSKASDPEQYAMKFEIVKREDGSISATPRTKPFKDLPEERKGMNLMVRSPFSDRMRLESSRRGKYGDADRLLFNEYGTAEVGEVKPVGSVC